MTVDQSISGIVIVLYVILLLLVLSVADIRSRTAPNSYLVGGGGIGILIEIAMGVEPEIILRVISLAFTMALALSLYRIGAVGGGDVKTLIVVALLSPGLPTTTCDYEVLEAVLAGGIELFVMLLLGTIHLRFRSDGGRTSEITPLIPYLLIGYLVVQIASILC